MNDNDAVLDDPRLTAYALGELPAGDRAAVEAILAQSAAARAFVDDVRAASGVLVGAYSAAPVPSLDDAHRTAIRAKAARPVPAGKGQVLRVAHWRVPATIAAAALVAVLFHSQFGGERSGSAPVGRNVFQRFGTDASEHFVTIKDGSDARPSAAAFFNAADENGDGGQGGLGGTMGTGTTYNMGGAGGGGGARTAEPPKKPRVLMRTASAYEVTEPRDREQLEKLKTRVFVDGELRAGGPGYNGGGTGGGLIEANRAARVVRRDPLVDPRRANVAGEEGRDGLSLAGIRQAGGGGGKAARPRVAPFQEWVPNTGGSGSGGAIGGGGAGHWKDVYHYADGSQAEISADHLRQIALAVQIDPTKLTAGTVASYVGSGGGGGNAGGHYEFRTALTNAGLVAAAPDPNVFRIAMKDGTFYDFEITTGALRTAEPRETGRESYADLNDNPFTKVGDAPLSTFGVDVDTASYANVRRILNSGQLPPPGAVRIEEMVNYFPYAYAAPTDGGPFAAHVDVTGCPWDMSHRLVRIGVKGQEVHVLERPAANLVFLVDVSGSMSPANKLPLVVQSMKLLVEHLQAKDRVSIVVYAGSSGLVLAPTAGDRKGDILAALDRLSAGGSTNGGQGIELAYKTAAESFAPGGINRVILATDGDFNVGVTDDSSLVRLIEEKAKQKVFLSVLGVGDGNLQDHKMEQLADKGNGNYAYLDTLREAKKVLVDQVSGTLQTIAKDLKVQVEFNPLRVASYRLIGYENRMLAAQDFADDRKDAGDVGAGHTVTALYEIVPVTTSSSSPTESLRYQQGPQPSSAAHSGELLTVKMRWKAPEGDVSTLRERPIMDDPTSYAQASPDLKFAAAVAAFGMILRDSPHKGTATLGAVEELAGEGLGFDPGGHRAEFLDLVRKAKSLRR